MKHTWILTAFALVLGCTTSGEPAASTQSALRTCYEEGDPACFEDIESSTTEDVYDVCFEEHLSCVEAGAFECDALLEACFGVYDETGDPSDAIGACYGDGEECTRAHGDDELCLEGLRVCLASIDEPMSVDEAPDVAELCFEGHILCLEVSEDPAECDGLLDECIVVACPPEHPVDPSDPCIEAIEHCMESSPEGEDPTHCIDIVEGCYGEEPELPPCEEEFFACLEATEFESPEACEPILWACEEPQPNPDACFEEFDACLMSGAPAESCEPILESCEDSEPSGPDCIEEHIACLDSGLGPEECDPILWACDEPVEPAEPGPSDACEDEFVTCLESGQDPAQCEPLLLMCEPGEDPPHPGEELCLEDFHACVESGLPAEACEPILEACFV